MTFDYILKKCEELGVPMTERVAKGIVRKYGKRKDFLSSEDCSSVINRRYAMINSKRGGNTGNANNTPKKARVSASGSRK